MFQHYDYYQGQQDRYVMGCLEECKQKPSKNGQNCSSYSFKLILLFLQHLSLVLLCLYFIWLLMTTHQQIQINCSLQLPEIAKSALTPNELFLVFPEFYFNTPCLHLFIRKQNTWLFIIKVHYVQS